jgi:peptidoglycan/xylan/chitin deacetylase (PgdA/CDA1 family)/folate-dependent phosphoribosylglycinamide formyltransferase PurN
MHARSESAQGELQPARTSVPAPGPIRKVVIFTGDLQLYSVRKGIVELVREFSQTEWLILEHAPRKSIRTLIRSQWRNVRKNGWRWFPYQSWEIAQRLIPRRNRAAPAAESMPGAQFAMSTMLGMPNLRHLKVADMHGEDVLAQVRAFGPDLGISLAAPILRPSLFEIPRQGTVNLHKGRLPDYRGMPPAFWELFNGESEIGCTIHRVERGLDTGPILVEGTVTRSKYSTVRGAQLKLDELGVTLTCDAVRLMRDGRAAWKSQGSGGRTYTKPTLRQVAAMQTRFSDGEPGAWVRRMCKEAFFRGYVQFARRMARPSLGWLNRQRIVILLYHRVSDELRDSLTVGIEKFDAQMEWISRRHPVVSIADIIHGRVPRNTLRPVIAVTFDDGYLDNYENAVPILLRHQVPAGFFVSTGKIGRTEGFPHDLTRLGKPLPTMSWENLRHMRDLGFVVGSHTVTHLDCGSADLDTVRRELIESRDALKQNLGLDEVIFAYPFGGRSNMNAAALRLVRELGYAGCLSAYGGHIGGQIDPYNVERVGIGSNFTMLAFRAALEGFY